MQRPPAGLVDSARNQVPPAPARPSAPERGHLRHNEVAGPSYDIPTQKQGRAICSSLFFVSARQDLNLRPLRPEGLGENSRARHTAQTIVIRTFISFHNDYSIDYSYFKTKS
jgi:hypothetical protein